MPTYRYKCDYCGDDFELFARISEHRANIVCECGNLAHQVIEPPTIIIPEHMKATGNNGVYESPIDGRLITSKKARIEDLSRSNCIEYDPGMKQDADRKVKDNDDKLDKLIDETFDKELEKMPVKKRERLETEMINGITAESIRL